MSIPVMQIFRDSFAHFKDHKINWLRLAFAPAVIYSLGMLIVVITSGAAIFSLQNQNLSDATGLMIFGRIINFILSLIAMFSLYINGYRFGILNEGGDSWWLLQMNKRMVFYFLYSLLVGVIAIGLVLLGFGLVLLAHLAAYNTALNIVVGALYATGALYVLFRLSLVFPLVAIEHERPMSTSWNLMRGNVLRLLGLFILITLKILLIVLAGLVVLGLIGWLLYLIVPFLVIVPILFAIIFFLYIWLLNWAVITKAFSLVYLSFTAGKV
jgi:hypothetical protein